MGFDDVAEKSATGQDTLAYYRRMVDRSLSRGDHMYAVEYSWVAYALAIQLAQRNCGMAVAAASDTMRAAQQVNEAALAIDAEKGAKLRIAFHAARSLHQHFYEADLPDDEVERSVGEVMDAIDLLQALFYRNR